MEIAKAYDPKQAEENHYERWEKSGFFAPEINEDPNAEKYSIVIPPPNVTGSLHMGHALQHTIMDVLTRRKRMQGYRTLWLPGTDHAGISVQRKVVEQLKKNEHKSPLDIGREEFVRRAWAWKEEYGNTIIDQMKREGASVDWSRHRFTMDESLSKAVRNVFCKLYEEGWIYKGLRIVNWCPKDKTVLSDLEVKEETRKDGKLYYLKYPVNNGKSISVSSVHSVVSKDNQSGTTESTENTEMVENPQSAIRNPQLTITVATTRPETMLGDTAVAVNAKDERYKHLIGKSIALPLTNREIPIIGDEYVDPEFGTGAVKITPAHDPNDYQVGQRHDLEQLLVMNEDATMNASAGPEFEGLDRFIAREKVVERFEELGLLEKIEDYEITLPVCERCKTIVEPILSDQWFVKMDEMRDMALDLMRTEGVPHFSPQVPHEKVYTAWLENLKDWTISRQLWWGHQIPAWYDANGNVHVARSADEAYEQAGTKKLTQDQDVLDTWFSSGLWAFSTFGWTGEQVPSSKSQIPSPKSQIPSSKSQIPSPKSQIPSSKSQIPSPKSQIPSPKSQVHSPTSDVADDEVSRTWDVGHGTCDDLQVFLPTDVLVTGRDIIFLWVSRMVMLTRKFVDKRPFDDVIITGTVLGKDGKPMSKSRNNGVDPIEMFDKFGVDATRIYLASIATGADIKWNDIGVETYRNFANKIWNATRFCLMNSDGASVQSSPPYEGGVAAASADGLVLSQEMTLADRWIISCLNRTALEVNKSLAKYEFHTAVSLLYHFFWDDFCDWYIELVKDEIVGTQTSLPASAGGPEARVPARSLILSIIEQSLRLLHPFMPYLTEELWQKLPGVSSKLHNPAYSKAGQTIMLTNYPVGDNAMIDEQAENEMQSVIELITKVRNIRSEMNIKAGDRVSIHVAANVEMQSIFNANEAQIKKLARADKIVLGETLDVPKASAKTVLTGGAEAAVPLEGLIDFEKERERLQNQIAKLDAELQRLNGQLSNASFLEKAPSEKVAELRERKSEIERQLETLGANLEALK